jgi:NAD(P)H-dependent FMN reductase
MPTERPIVILSGTNRAGSNALRISTILAELYARAGVRAELLSLADVSPDIFLPASYAAKPPAMVALQQRILDAAGLHVVTPEYNGSFPGVLKYFIDLLKFPESFDHKPVAFVGEANGAWGGLRAVEQLQMVFAYRNAHLYPKRVFISGVKDKFDAAGKFNDGELMKRFEEQCAGFAKFVGAVTA